MSEPEIEIDGRLYSPEEVIEFIQNAKPPRRITADKLRELIACVDGQDDTQPITDEVYIDGFIDYREVADRINNFFHGAK